MIDNLPNSESTERGPLPGTQINDLLTVGELASLLKVPKSWIYDHTRKRGIEKLPHIKLGKYLRFFEADVLAYLHRIARSHGR
jgi:excisionase family DNA binding protein